MKIKSTLRSATAFLFLSLSFFKVNAQANVQDSLALVDLYNSTNGPAWYNHTNWLTSNPLSTWAGVSLTGDRVSMLLLSSNDMVGPLPASIGNLTAVTILSLGHNSLTGALPVSIGNMTSVENLYLSFNQFSGTIPESIGNLPNLTQLQLAKNAFTGTVPASFQNLDKLYWLELQFNNLSGNIPLTVCNIPTLQILKLDDNQFTGPIPKALGRLTKLVVLDLRDNQLSGAIPDSIFTIPNLGELHLQNNQLTKLPVLSFNVPVLATLELQNNQLSGPIPFSFGNLTGLTYLDLSSNKLTGSLPASIKNLKGLGGLYLGSNALTIQPAMLFDPAWFPYLRQLDFKSNKFTFNGIESIAQSFAYKFTYSPQANIAVHQHGDALAVSAGGTLANNTYSWFKVGTAGSTVIAGDSTFHPAGSGKYYAKIKNAVAAKLTLATDTFTYTMALKANAVAANKTIVTTTLYPNPVKGNQVHVQVNSGSAIIITDINGRTMFSGKINGEATINTASFKNGLYYLKNKNTGESIQFEIQR